MLWLLVFGIISTLQAAKSLRDTTSTRFPSDNGLRVRALPKPENWTKYSVKGQNYWDAWKDKTGLDTGSPDWMNNEESHFNKEGLTDSIRNTVQSTIHPFNEDDCWLARITVAPLNGGEGKTVAKGKFQLSVNPKQGVLISNSAYWYDAREGRHFSDVMWWAWTKVLLEDDDCNSALDPSTLNSIWSAQISNRHTRDLLRYALQDENEGTYYFQPNNPGNADNAFWPLIGSPNGCSIIFLLTDYKKALKSKAIKQLAVNKKHIGGIRYEYTMWADLVSPPPGF